MNYAGIGSRKTPQDILAVMEDYAALAAQLGFILRSGAAPGADQAFERGSWNIGVRPEIFLPWRSFEGGRDDPELTEPTDAAMEMAAESHPNWRWLRQGAKKLHARNCHQILGTHLDDPVQYVVCWTPDGSHDGEGRNVGGTGQALRIAAARDIPIFNLADDTDFTTIYTLTYDSAKLDSDG